MVAAAPLGGPGQASLPGSLPTQGVDENAGANLADLQGFNAAAFSQAVDLRSPDIAAAPVTHASGQLNHVATEIRDLSTHLASWHKPDAATNSAAPTGTLDHAVPPSLTEAMGKAVSEMQGAYIFAIDTTLASRGSTEATKILNTLLKGQ